MCILCFSWGWGPAVWVWMPLQVILIHTKVQESWATLSFLPSSLSTRILNLEEGWQCSQGNGIFPSHFRSMIYIWKQLEGASKRIVSREVGLGGRCRPFAPCPPFCFLPELWMWGPAGKLPPPSLRQPHGKSALKIEEPKGRNLFPIIRSQSNHTSYGFLSSRFP